MKRLVLVLLVLVALIGAASAQHTCSCVKDCTNCTNTLPSYATFKMTSQVQGDGLVVADRDVKMPSPDTFYKTPEKYCCVDADGNPGQQLKMHTHGTGSYEEQSDINYNLNDNVATLTFNDSATMTYAAASVPTQSVNVQWKEDTCLKDYQIGAAMRERYYAAESVTKQTKGNITSVATKMYGTPNQGYGYMSMSVDSSFTGWGHFGVLSTDGKKTKFVDVSEDYFGTYQMKKTASIKVPKTNYPTTPPSDWLPCNNPSEWVQESCPQAASW